MRGSLLPRLHVLDGVLTPLFHQRPFPGAACSSPGLQSWAFWSRSGPILVPFWSRSGPVLRRLTEY